MTVFGAYVGFQFVATLYLQDTLHWSALHTALAFLPAGLLVAFGAPQVGKFVDRFGTSRLIAVGALLFVAGYAVVLAVVSGVAGGSGNPIDVSRSAVAVVLAVAVLGLVVAAAGLVPARREVLVEA